MKDVIKAQFHEHNVLTENSDEARQLYEQSRFGSIVRERVQLSLLEAYYLLEKGKIVILDGRNREMTEEAFLKRAKRDTPNFMVRYAVFRDIRDRGYIIKTALKFGAEFRIYNRGVKPGEDHAKWICYPVHEKNAITWYEFAAKNRVAHSTKKRLLIGVVDDEQDVSYWEVRWLKP